MKSIPRYLFCLLLCALTHITRAETVKYYSVPLGDIGFTSTDVNQLGIAISRNAQNSDAATRYPSIRFENPDNQAYITFPPPEEGETIRWWQSHNQRELIATLKVTGEQTANGEILLIQYDTPPQVAHTFEFTPNDSDEVTEAEFETAQANYYARFANSTIPGGDWFRYKAGDAYAPGDEQRRRQNLGEFDSSFNMFSGQRAVSENLALDRELILGTSEGDDVVDIENIRGVTVEAIDWSERISDAPTSIDPLANVIPHDQHAAFFGSIKALNQVIDLVDEEGIRYFQTVSNRNSYKGLADRYQRQMGLMFPDMLAEQLPVESVALTGGDPFLPSGSDLAIIFETDTPDALLETLNLLIKTQAELNGGNMSTEHIELAEYSYGSYDRSFSSHIFAGENFVAVTNSSEQVKHIQATASGDTPSLGSLEEFKFFRQRYPLENADTAFIFLSDATIRRWAGPEVRIGASRRVRAAAALGQATAQLIDGGEFEQDYQELTGEIVQSGSILRSEIFNTLEFLTPISELKINTVTAAENEAYERWRQGYENGWVQFDPIALSLRISEDSLALDLSVIPLRLGSDYNTWMDITGEATLDEEAITPHPESLFMFSHAIDTSSETFLMADLQSSSMLPGIGANPLAWVGGSLSVFVDEDPLWEEMLEAEYPETFIEENIARLPVGLRVSSKSPIKLALFLTTLRSFSEQAAPGLLIWETLDYEGTPYVAIRTTEEMGLPGEFRIHYAALPDAFLLSLNEEVLKRAISRTLNQPESESEATGSETSPQLFTHSKLSALKTYMQLLGEDPMNEQQFTSWAALPILNEWRSIYPDQDPIAVHAKYFHEQINCPGGQGYQWNEEIGSMESVAFGHPLSPRESIIDLPFIDQWSEASAGIELQDSEFRLEAKLTK